jgi:hypothetical protein
MLAFTHGAELMSMIDQDLKDYLEVKFNSIEDKIDGTKDDIKRHSDEIRQLYDMDRDGKERIRTLESFREDHTRQHAEKTNGKRFNLEMWVLIGLFAIDKIGSWISSYLPAP